MNEPKQIGCGLEAAIMLLILFVVLFGSVFVYTILTGTVPQ